jgi:hypothetical protein
VKERDWTLLNAYADGELEPNQEEALAARLRREPALAAELDRILALKSRLGGLRKSSSQRLGATPKVRMAAMAFVTSLLFVAILGFAAIEGTSTSEPMKANLALTLHSDFAALSYPERAARAPMTQIGEITPPDLSGSNLRLVDMRRGVGLAAEAVGYHYRGPRGCRVTLVVGMSLASPGGTVLARGWTVGDRTLVLIADGMDPRRFAAIADFAESATRDAHTGDDLRIALEKRTAAARPCV